MNTREEYRIILSLICLTLALALAICEIFALPTGFDWVGGLALGGGQGIDGIPLEQAGGKTTF